jgi:hypothetical protein
VEAAAGRLDAIDAARLCHATIATPKPNRCASQATMKYNASIISSETNIRKRRRALS